MDSTHSGLIWLIAFNSTRQLLIEENGTYVLDQHVCHQVLVVEVLQMKIERVAIRRFK